MPSPQSPEPVNPQKLRRGVARVWHATGYSLAGLRAAWLHPAFRLEVLLALVLLPAATVLARSWVEAALLAGSVLLVMIVELLNTAIESVVDRTGLEWNALSKQAKDMGSAAVFLSVLLASGVWIAALAERFIP
ncbi:diacylglycerol kinase [Ramlibacter sp. AN1015]|uniref:diacylglycerol kinase n=1 Tax=Ramlibacter sp. AN1015 TaxID=3133428 RepID=UPI0030C48784